MFDPKTNIMSSLITELNLVSPLKTMNYDGQDVRLEIREKIIEYGKQFLGWNPFIGDIVKISKTMLNT
jgi:hypothetical protein